MSYFSMELRRLIEQKYLSIRQFSEKVDIPHNYISRYVNGRIPPTKAKITHLVKKLDRDDRVNLTIAYARDCLPSEMQNHLEIGPASHNGDSPPSPQPQLPTELQSVIDFLTRKAFEEDAVAEYLASLGKILQVIPHPEQKKYSA